MTDFSQNYSQIKHVSDFQELLSTPFIGEINAMCWSRSLQGDFSEIVSKIALVENMMEIDLEQLIELDLTKQGILAREILMNDLNILKEHGASPTLNLIKNYDRDDSFPFFPTDVYSFHVDRSPIPTDTFLCTYLGAPSEIIPNSQAIQKVLVPEIRMELKKLFEGSEEGFEAFLTEYFFDLHYQPKSNSKVISLGLGHICKLATDYPESNVLPCVHRAPRETNDQNRLLLIC